MKTVYAVNSVCYSDYKVVGIFTTREKAEEFMKIVPSSEYNKIEEFELDATTSINMVKRGYVIWLVSMRINGDVLKIEKSWYPIIGDINEVPSYDIYKASPYYHRHKEDHLFAKVWAKTEKAAIKIVNDKRVQMIANNEWK